MFSYSKWIALPALAFGLMFLADAPEASAQYGCYGGNGYGSGYGSGISFGSNLGGGYGYQSQFRAPSYRSNYPSHGYRSNSRYHDTTHLDWHPTQVRRHGSHYHVQPGHYDVHQSGHWHH